MVTQERLKELLSYDPETGVFTWLSPKGNRKSGSIAGYTNGQGYIHITIDWKLIKAHRLAWLYMYGKWPEKFIDHIDGERANNRIANLRDVSNSVNQQNQKGTNRYSKTGFLGVARNGNRFGVELTVNGKRKYFGNYSTPEEAYEVSLAARRMHHEGCTL